MDLAVIVPTRGRPGNIDRLIDAWDFTNAWGSADLILSVDADDPEIENYRALFDAFRRRSGDPLFSLQIEPVWRPMVHKLDRVAVAVAEQRSHFALAFAGDDHVPETIGWAQRYLTVLREMGTGMVYGDDGYQGAKLSTEWAVTSDVVRAIGRMVPAPVEHLYCDDAMMDLFGAAGALRHLPEVRIEHRHPVAGKAVSDDQYKRVNDNAQYRKDRAAYESWKGTVLHAEQIDKIKSLRGDRPAEPGPAPARPTVRRSTPRRSGPTSERIRAVPRYPFTAEFKQVRGATPDEIALTLADFARQVPADQEIVELGVFNGRTALIMAWGAKQGHGAHVTAIDPWDLPGNVYDPPFTDADSRNWAHYWVSQLGYADRIELIQTFSENIAPNWGAQPGQPPVGLLFVDGDHTKEGARRDIEAWARHLAPGAVIAVDDYGHPDWPGVGEAIDELVAEGFLAPVEIYHDRLAVTRLTGVIERTDPTQAPITAITSEGVEPDPEGSDDLPGLRPVETVDFPDQDFGLGTPASSVLYVEDEATIDTSVSGGRDQVAEGEMSGVEPGTSIEDLNIGQLRTLARIRGIRLGARKDLRESMLQALRDGK